MSQFDEIIVAMQNESYSTKRQLLEYLLRMLQSMKNGKNGLKPEDKTALLEYAYGEVEVFLGAIADAASYKEKDLIFGCEDLLLGLIMQLCPTSEEIPSEILNRIKLLVELVEKERYIETTLDKLFQQESISEGEICDLLSLVERTEDEYQKGMLYSGLVHYKKDISKLSGDAVICMSGHIRRELERYLAAAPLGIDCINNLELMADISRFYADDAVIGLLGEMMKLGHCNINYYAADTLLFLGRSVPGEVIRGLAYDLEYANLTYLSLRKYGKTDLFPRECAAEEYLAKSDLVHWLTYPTELGKAPDEIEYLGKITYLFRKDVYHVFKYRSGSDTLDEKLKNKWLIGWSSEDGGTFSNFDEYALYEKATVAATLKNIKKKLIG